ncbi:MAG: bifunctional DNA primase/polymerase [Candidatus Levybacteria bacterium]|nr:bifunctional DNA primase/polymerase [Candidatus Levybacteria bacterium]
MNNLDNNTNYKLEQALSLLKLGWSIIPLGIDKRPLIEWKPFQSEKASGEQLKEWFSKTEVNIGVVTGKISNLIVVDIDPRHGGTEEDFKEVQTIKSATGGGGWHYYFQYVDGVQNSANIKPGIDIRGEGGYVVVPPSSHSSGKDYEWIVAPDTTDKLIPLPKFIKEWIGNQKGKSVTNGKSRVNNLLNGVEEGNRNESAASVVGKLLKRFKEDEWENEAWALFQAWNKQNNPPLLDDELRTIFESIAKAETSSKEDEEGDRRTVADKLVDLVLESGSQLYIDQTNEPHITFPEKTIVGFPIKSSIFRRWLSGMYWSKANKGFSGDTLSQVVNSLEGKAFFEGETVILFNRIARQGTTIFYDLGDDEKVVKITPQGWEITKDCPVKFRRFSHQLAQVEPLEGGKLEEITKYVNLKTETDKLLFLTYLITVAVPDIPRVVLINIGDQGAAKSTALRIARSIIDPSVAELLSPPSDINELAQASNHHYCLYLDNLSNLRDELSDALCRLATGIGFTKRKLFTNDEDVLFNQKTAVGITGINLVAQRADLLDRCLILSYERIPEERRADEEEFWKNFTSEKPYILGALFTNLSHVLRMITDFKLSKKPRMADYAKYAAAGAIALGRTSEEFLSAFSENIGRQNQAAIESSPTAQSILQFMSLQDDWSGSSSDLHKELKLIVDKANLQLGGSDGFPKSSNWLWKRIMQIRPNLLSLGISAVKSESETSSVITLKKSSKDTENTAITTSTTNGQSDMAAMAVNSPKLEDMDEADIKSIFGMEEA